MIKSFSIRILSELETPPIINNVIKYIIEANNMFNNRLVRCRLRIIIPIIKDAIAGFANPR